MKKKIFLIMCALTLTVAPTFAAPQGGGHGGGGMNGGGMHSGAPSVSRGGGMPASHMGGAGRPNMGARPMNMGGGRAPIHGGVHYAGARPMPIYTPHHHHMYRPFYPVYPYYSYYYPTYYSTYSYYPTDYVYDEVPVASEGGTVIVRDNYAGVNATANVINAAANAAAAIKFLTW
jgi:hypothetical protein